MSFDKELVAPCGINCGTCIAYLREKNRCEGCITESNKKVNHCYVCKIRNCEEHKKYNSPYCSDCSKMPCILIKNIDKRYSIRYSTSLIENLEYLKENGIDEYLKRDEKRFICKNCGNAISIHRNKCINCGKEYTKKLYSNKYIVYNKEMN